MENLPSHRTTLDLASPLLLVKANRPKAIPADPASTSRGITV